MNGVAAKAIFEAEVARLKPRLLELRNWDLRAHEYPHLEVVFHATGRPSTLLRLHCDDWNALPPSVEILAADGQPNARPLQGGPGIFNPSAHPRTGKPFICMAGVREYHTHPSHLQEAWEVYRTQSGYDLGGIITRIWNGWSKTPP